jgi:hypothetical protein
MKFLDTLRAGPPPPKIALLPDALFFTRALSVAAGATAAEAAAQVELALEAISPFPLAQLYYGWFWTPGAERAMAFAAYRRRFTSEQTAAWSGVELVLPAFAAVMGANVEPATTIILAASDGLTAIHWEAGPVPAKILCQMLPAEATDDERARARDELIRAVGGSKTIVDLATPLVAEPALNDREVAFRAGEFRSRLPAAAVATLDVRDKDELAALRRARRRDVTLWRVALGCAAALALLAGLEVARFGGLQWQKVRLAKFNAQQPRVELIQASNTLAIRIDDLTTKRLLPLEMLGVVTGKDRELLPAGMIFTRISADAAKGLYTLNIEGSTNNAGQISIYQSALEKLPACEKVDMQVTNTRGDLTIFRLVVTFKPDAVKSASTT